jgi:hypothetical protein
VFIEELVNAGVNAQADAPYVAEKVDRLLFLFPLSYMERHRIIKKRLSLFPSSRCDEGSMAEFLQRLLDLLFCVHDRNRGQIYFP